ncbi:MAG: adenosylcobinamide-GDP ribazoletransferase [Anaerolineales bacterium]|jgi:adenosylcobinamide-GDP ribazoletransferase
MEKEPQKTLENSEEGLKGITGIFSPILVAAQFLTIVPPIIKRVFTKKELGRAVGFFPLIGVVIGFVLLGVEIIFSFVLPQTITAALVLGLWILFTGALHIDGLLDSMDGLFGAHTPEKRLLIMQDERVGAFAFAGGAILILLKFTALASLDSLTAPLLLAPTLGRWAVTLAVPLFPYGREEGLGRAMKDHANWRQIEAGTIITMLVAWFTWGWYGLILLPITLLLTMAAASYVLKRLPGLTGDIYGALCEITETIILLLFVVI